MTSTTENKNKIYDNLDVKSTICNILIYLCIRLGNKYVPCHRFEYHWYFYQKNYVALQTRIDDRLSAKLCYKLAAIQFVHISHQMQMKCSFTVRNVVQHYTCKEN